MSSIQVRIRWKVGDCTPPSPCQRSSLILIQGSRMRHSPPKRSAQPSSELVTMRRGTIDPPLPISSSRQKIQDERREPSKRMRGVDDSGAHRLIDDDLVSPMARIFAAPMPADGAGGVNGIPKHGASPCCQASIANRQVNHSRQRHSCDRPGFLSYFTRCPSASLPN